MQISHNFGVPVKLSFSAKVCLLGDGAVGKTSLKDRFTGGGFRSDYFPTIGTDLVSTKITLETEEGSKDLIFQIWDIAGQPRFNQVRSFYYRRAVGALLVFDVSRPETMQNLEFWMSELFANASTERLTLAVMGNKVDLRDKEDCISSEAASKYVNQEMATKCDKLGAKIFYIESSAKTGFNVDRAFHELGSGILDALYSPK